MAKGHLFGMYGRSVLRARGNKDTAPVLLQKDFAMKQRTNVPAVGVADIFSDGDALEHMASEHMLGALASTGAFDRVAAASLPMQPRQRIGSATGIMFAASTDEGAPFIPQPLLLSDAGDAMVPKKVGTLVCVTRESVNFPSTAQIIEREALTGLSAGSDKLFCDDLIAGTTPIVSENLPSDVAALLDGVVCSASSRLFLLFPPECVKKMAMARAGSALLYPEVEISGGFVAGATVIPTDGLTDAAICLDARQLGIWPGDVSVDYSEEGDVSLQSDASMPAQLVSMWQSGLVGLAVRREMAYAVFRAAAVASISGIAY